MDSSERAHAAAIETNIGLRVLKLVGQTMAALRLSIELSVQLIDKLSELGASHIPIHRCSACESSVAIT
eukprot:SAG31_NODE_771_length_12216_cov_5.603862_7_plen_69_part_00